MENESVYKAPDSSLETSNEQAVDINQASAARRLANFLVDYVGYLAFSFLIGLAISLSGSTVALELLESAPDIVLSLVLMIIYYVSLETIFARTLGKLLSGTRVISEDGSKPGFLQILGRTLCRFIPFEIFSFLGESGRGWHDSISKTYVITNKDNV